MNLNSYESSYHCVAQQSGPNVDEGIHRIIQSAVWGFNHSWRTRTIVRPHGEGQCDYENDDSDFSDWLSSRNGQRTM